MAPAAGGQVQVPFVVNPKDDLKPTTPLRPSSSPALSSEPSPDSHSSSHPESSPVLLQSSPSPSEPYSSEPTSLPSPLPLPRPDIANPPQDAASLAATLLLVAGKASATMNDTAADPRARDSPESSPIPQVAATDVQDRSRASNILSDINSDMTIPSPFRTLEHEPAPVAPALQQRPTLSFGTDDGATGRGILIGMLSAFGSAFVVLFCLALIYFLRYTARGRILLDRMGRPGQFDDEQAFLREETEALEAMDDIQRAEYQRAKAFVQANPPETTPTDISLSQFLAIQEKGVSAWEFEPELEIANCFVEARTEIEFFDSESSVQSNLPIPKQNEVYYWEAKIYDKPESTLISIGLTTKPYPLFRLPGFHKTSLAYLSSGHRRFNQPFLAIPYPPDYVQGDVVGVGYRPRTGTVFFTRNGKKLDDVAHGLKSQNFFPTVGANGPCTVHVNFGQSGFVFIEANVKKWGLAPTTGSLAPPPPYGSEQGSILLEAGGELGTSQPPSSIAPTDPRQRRLRGRFTNVPVAPGPTSPGPLRSPTEISLAQLAHVPSNHEDLGEGTSRSVGAANSTLHLGHYETHLADTTLESNPQAGIFSHPPPEYSSAQTSPQSEHDHARGVNVAPAALSPRPAVPSYEDAVGQRPPQAPSPVARARAATEDDDVSLQSDFTDHSSDDGEI